MSNETKQTERKFKAFVISTIFITVFNVVAFVMMYLIPDQAEQIVSLMSKAYLSFCGVAGLYVGGQSFVDWKINSTTK